MKPIDLQAQQTYIREALRERIDRVLDHGQYVLGPEVEEFEQRLCDESGAQYAVTVASGTDALMIALMTLGVGPGDEVITSPFTFIATAEVIRRLGAQPVFCDIEKDTWLMDPTLIEPLITPRTRTIMPVDLYGQCADYTAIKRVTAPYGIPVIADAAQSFGAAQRGQRVGTLATLTATSFYPSKPLGAYGDGGALLTDAPELAAIARSVRDHGRDDDGRFVRFGLNSRLDTLQCAILLAKMTVFEEELQRRRKHANRYGRRLDDGRVQQPTQRPWNDSNWAHYTIEIEHRDKALRLLQARGIPARAYYPRPVHLEPAYAATLRACCPVAERAAKHVLSLPMHPYLDASDLRAACETLMQIISTLTSVAPPVSSNKPLYA